MEVPDHIYIKGNRRHRANSHTRLERNRLSLYADDMQVPDKITVGKDGTLIAHPSQPNDILRDKIQKVTSKEQIVSLPNKITANEFPSTVMIKSEKWTGDLNRNGSPQTLQQPIEAAESSTNLNISNAVDLDPIRELKNVRRQMGRLSTRILELEDLLERRNTREYGMWALLTSSIALIAFFLAKR